MERELVYTEIKKDKREWVCTRVKKIEREPVCTVVKKVDYPLVMPKRVYSHGDGRQRSRGHKRAILSEWFVVYSDWFICLNVVNNYQYVGY